MRRGASSGARWSPRPPPWWPRRRNRRAISARPRGQAMSATTVPAPATTGPVVDACRPPGPDHRRRDRDLHRLVRPGSGDGELLEAGAGRRPRGQRAGHRRSQHRRARAAWVGPAESAIVSVDRTYPGGTGRARSRAPWTLAGRRRDTEPMGHRVSCPTFVGRAEELDVLAATFDGVAGGRAGHRARRRRRRHRQDPAGRRVLRAGPRPWRARRHRRVRARRRRRPALRAGRRHPPRRRRASWATPAAAAVLGSAGAGLGLPRPGVGGCRRPRTRPCPASADELAKTRLFESILGVLHDAGRAVDRSSWSSRTCSGRTRPAPSC